MMLPDTACEEQPLYVMEYVPSLWLVTLPDTACEVQPLYVVEYVPSLWLVTLPDTACDPHSGSRLGCPYAACPLGGCELPDPSDARTQ